MPSMQLMLLMAEAVLVYLQAPQPIDTGDIAGLAKAEQVLAASVGGGVP